MYDTLRCLTTNVLMPIPLTSTLRVEMQLIIQHTRSSHDLPLPIISLLLSFQLPYNLILKHPPPKARKLHILQSPIQLNMFARLDLRTRLLHDHGREQVQCANLIFDGAIVPVAPRAALRLARDMGEVVEGGEDMCGARGAGDCRGGLCGGRGEGGSGGGRGVGKG